MNTLIFSLEAVLPIMLVILAGYGIQKTKILTEDFFKQANTFVFKFALPLYLFYSVYGIEDVQDINVKLLVTAVALVLVVFFLALVTILIYTKDAGKRGALIQASFRSNYAIIGLPLAKAMGGDAALANAALISAVGIPLFNALAVVTLTIFSYDNEGKKISVSSILKSIITNPLIIGVFCGVVIVFMRRFTDFRIKDDMPALYGAIENIGGIASPLALIVLGGRFKVSAVKELAHDIAVGVVWRLVLTPVIGLGIAVLLAAKGIVNIDNAVYPALIAFFCSPTAVSSAIMAESMHSHGELARQLVIWTNIVSVFTLFVTIALFRSLGML